MEGNIFQIQRFSTHDGPGIRTTVFLKGCPLRCFWCHNPESQNVEPVLMYSENKCTGCGNCVERCPQHGVSLVFPESGEGAPRSAINRDLCINCGECVKTCYAKAREISGKKVTAQEVMDEVIRDYALYLESGGGVTFSGGEALVQIDFLEEMLKRCKDEGLHTAVESCMCVPWTHIERILPYVDLWFNDIKAVRPEHHKEGTGVSNELILENISKLVKEIKNTDTKICIRRPLIPGFNDSKEDIKELGLFVKNNLGLDTDVIELLKYNNLGESKYTRMGRDKKEMLPQSQEYIDELYEILKKVNE